MAGGGVALGDSLADLKDFSEREESELSRDGKEMGEPLRLLRKDSARLRRDSVLFRRMAARLSVGDLTSPPDLASPEVRMNPRIELEAVLRSGSLLSFPEGDFPGVVSFDVFLSVMSFVSLESFETLGVSFGFGMLLCCVAFDDPSDGTVELGCNGPIVGRSPEGVEITWGFARTALTASPVPDRPVSPGRRRPCGFGGGACCSGCFFSTTGMEVRVIMGVIMNTSSSPRVSSSLSVERDLLSIGREFSFSDPCEAVLGISWSG